jgi:capsular exopolysaccharide synthesis family protein
MARTRGRGLLIDSDLRNPQLHKIFDVENSRGLSAYLTGNARPEEDFIRKTRVENLDIITAGVKPPNPSDLLNSPRLGELVRALEARYSFVIFDSPPAIGFSDSLILSTNVEGVIMVVRSGRTTKDSAIQTRKSLEGINSKILGVVLNAISYANLKYSAYYHYSGYYYDGNGHRTEKRKSIGDKT